MVVWMAAAEQGGSMTRGGTPLQEHRRLRGRLKSAREMRNLTQREVAEALDWSASKLIRIENGSVGISITDLKALLLHYGITNEADVDRLVEMARASKRSAWWHEYRHQISQQLLTFIGLESSAIRIRQYQNLLIPGLLQIPDYIKFLMTLNGTEEGARANFEVRRRRQDLIDMDNPPEFFFILDESVLYRQVGDAAVMREQLLKLKELADRPNISLRVLPFSAGPHPGMKGSFEIIELSDEPDDYEGYSKPQLIEKKNSPRPASYASR
jgi:transcriptional regulator with XRE-family HTH domain